MLPQCWSNFKEHIAIKLYSCQEKYYILLWQNSIIRPKQKIVITKCLLMSSLLPLLLIGFAFWFLLQKWDKNGKQKQMMGKGCISLTLLLLEKLGIVLCCILFFVFFYSFFWGAQIFKLVQSENVYAYAYNWIQINKEHIMKMNTPK